MELLIIVLVLVLIAGAMVFLKKRGFFCKEMVAYSGKDDMNFVHTAEKKLARVNIVDSYTKNGVKYLSFTTNVSGERRFLMTEDEYDKHFGKENDAVDCTIWSLRRKAILLRKRSKNMKRQWIRWSQISWKYVEDLHMGEGGEKNERKNEGV